MSRTICYKRTKISVLILILLILCNFKLNAQSVINGELNLNKEKYTGNEVIDLTGKWYFFYGKHLSAKQIIEIKSNEKVLMSVPSSWNNEKINGKYITAHGIGTYYLRIVLNKNKYIPNKTYGFNISSVISSYKLWVNNELIGQAGNATTNLKNYKPIYLPQTCYFNCNSDTLDVVMHVSNFTDPLYGGIWKKIYFGEHKNIESFSWLKKAFSLFILSAFILLFLYQLTIAFIQKEEKSHIIIALLSLISFIKLLSDGNVSIFNFLPNLDFTLYYKIWLWSFLIIPMILRLTKISYPTEVNRKIEKIFYVSYFALLAAFMILDIQYVISHLYIAIAVTFICIAYLFYVLIKAILRGRKYSVISLFGFSIMIFSILNDLMFLSFQFTYGYISHLGIILYIFIQTFTISLKFANSHKKVIQLSNQLIETNRNLEVLVGWRTKELHEINKELANINKQKDFLISTISHDLMGFFNTLITYTKALVNDSSMNETQHQALSKLFQTSNKGFLLLDNVLTWAKLQITYKPEMKTTDNLSLIIEDNLYLFSEQLETKSLKTVIDIDNSLLFNSNSGNLYTIIRNLLSNAIKYCNQDGTITITNKLVEDKVHITIHDNGIGMLYNELITVFDPEKTKKREGTAGERGSGLGLMIVKELVESNNGQIYCYSQLNQGTSFIMTFPKI